MAFISIFLMGAIFIFILSLILLTILVIQKTGMTLLAKKLNIPKYGLLWVPGLGSLYEAKLMNKFLDFGKVFEIMYFTLISIIRVVFLGFLLFGPNYNDNSFDLVSSIISDLFGVVMIFNVIFRTMSLKKNNYNIICSILIGIFLSPFWCYFASKKCS